MGFVQEFREFAVKGNVLDIAVGLIIGAAFNKIVTSMVNDILMPPIGWAIGGVNFKDLKLVLPAPLIEQAVAPGQPAPPPAAIGYGMFINSILEFLIIAFSCFVMVKVMNRVIRKREAAVAA